MRKPPLLLLFLLIVCNTLSAQHANKGYLDLRGHDLNRELYRLKGDWEFFANRLLTPDNIAAAGKSFVAVPSTWSTVEYGTYRLRVLLDKAAAPTELSLLVPSIYSACQVWINGNLAGSMGTPATTEQATVPAIRPVPYTFAVTSDTVDILLQASNFHFSAGGMKESPKLGSVETIKHHQSAIVTTDYVLFIVLIVIGLVAMALCYLAYKNRVPFLYLSLFVLTWLLRSAFCNQYRILDWVDVDWNLLIRIEYCGIYFTTILALLFLSSLFPIDFHNKKLKGAFIIACVSFTLFTIFMKPRIFTSFLWVYLTVCIVLVGYVLYIITKAFIYERAGAAIMLVTIFLGALSFGYVIVAYSGLVELNMLAYNLSFIILFSLLCVSVSVRLSRMDSLGDSDVLTMEHFYQKNL